MRLWLWRRPVALAPIRPLVWEPPYAPGSGPRKGKKTKKKKKKEISGIGKTIDTKGKSVVSRTGDRNGN